MPILLDTESIRAALLNRIHDGMSTCRVIPVKHKSRNVDATEIETPGTKIGQELLVIQRLRNIETFEIIPDPFLQVYHIFASVDEHRSGEHFAFI
jgi:hypothetical protein